MMSTGSIAFRLVVLVLVTGNLSSAEVVAVTPVEKVVQLLQGLIKKVEGEGAAEATAYDKFSCFCKEQSDAKLYAIESSTEKIGTLSDRISELDTSITEVDVTIGQLSTQITNLDNRISNNAAARKVEHTAFLSNLADADGAIDATQRAIDALTESKKAMGGKAEVEAELLAQLHSAASKAMVFRDRASLSKADVASLRSWGEPGKAYTSKYHSNTIIATLQNLLKSFKRTKARIQKEEFDAKTAHELKQQSLENEKKFTEKEKSEAEEQRATWAAEREEKVAERTQETADKTSDTEYLGVLQQDCEDTARFWDQRSSTRANELTAMGNAIDKLKESVAPNWSSNKKLVGLQQTNIGRATSFLQLRGSMASVATRSLTSARTVTSETRAAKQAQQVLMTSAKGLSSTVLSMVALKVGASEDHFVKVRQIIKDLIQRLVGDADSEAQQKATCDTQIANAVSTRDTAQQQIEDAEGRKSALNASIAALQGEIAELSAQIAANQHALAEATQLRDEQRKENENTVQSADDGKAAVEYAIQVLNNFYQPLGLAQKGAYVPPLSDREGLTVKDRAPEIFNDFYRGSQEASKGIIGILEVILSDFDRTVTTTRSSETAAEGKFNTFRSANEQDTTTKEGEVETKRGMISTHESSLVDVERDLDEYEQTHASAVDELTQLHGMCVAGEETWKQRRDARLKEVEALKQAHDILENWQK